MVQILRRYDQDAALLDKFVVINSSQYRNQLDVGSGIKDCVGYISLNAEDIQMHYGLILSSIIFVWKDDIM